MNDETAVRLKKLFDDMNAGTSLLTNEDVRDAVLMAEFPIDAPSVKQDEFTQALQELGDEDQGFRVSAFSNEVMLTTLEDRLKRKQEGRERCITKETRP